MKMKKVIRIKCQVQRVVLQPSKAKPCDFRGFPVLGKDFADFLPLELQKSINKKSEDK